MLDEIVSLQNEVNSLKSQLSSNKLLTGNLEGSKVGATTAPNAKLGAVGDAVGGELLRQYYAALTRLAGLSHRILDPERREDAAGVIAILESAADGLQAEGAEADIDQDVG